MYGRGSAGYEIADPAGAMMAGELGPAERWEMGEEVV